MPPTKQQIEQIAVSAGEQHGIYEADGRADVHALVERLGGAVEIEFGHVEKPESLVVRSAEDFTVYVAANTSVNRDRFTIAHELGHHYLHRSDVKGPVSFYRYGRSREETEANAFAAALLMPEASFRAAHAELDGDIRKLADRFGVSRSAAEVRVQVLKLS